MPSFVASDGVRLAYTLWPASGAAAPVLLAHGFAVDTELNWVRPGLVRALHHAGHRVIGIDARGHGASDKPHDPACYAPARLARDLLEIAGALVQGTYDLVGYSLGALVCAHAAAGNPRVRRLVLGGIGAALAEQGCVDLAVLSPETLKRTLLAPAATPRAGPAPADPVRAHVAAGLTDPCALSAQLDALRPEPQRLSDIQARTLVIAGRSDALAARPEVLVEAIPHAELALADGDHVNAPRSPDFRRELLRFLATP